MERAVKLASDFGPISFFRFVNDAFAAGDDGIADIDGAGEVEDISPDFLYAFGILGLDGDEAIGDDRAEEECDLGAVAGVFSDAIAELAPPVRRTQFVQNDKNFAGDRDDYIIDGSRREVLQISRLGDRRSQTDGRRTEGEDCFFHGVHKNSASLRKGFGLKLGCYIGMNTQRLQQVLAEASTKSVAVIGDVMLDRFIYGKVSRISPEAPVPVVEVTKETHYPGGAANVARNLRPFCREVFICGLTGEDAHAADLRALIEAEAVSPELLIASSELTTTVKTRVIARHQQVVRVDRENKKSPPQAIWERALKTLEAAADRIDAVIVEDYGKGFLSQEFLDGVLEIFRKRRAVVTVDPNPGNPLQWRPGITAIKPNRSEAFASAGEPPSEPADNPLEDLALLRVGATLLKRWEPESLLVTLGEHGMLLFERGKEPYHIPTKAREVFDVSGAGDTAIALFTSALAAGASFQEAAEISNFASGVGVGKLGTGTLSPQELLKSVEA